MKKLLLLLLLLVAVNVFATDVQIRFVAGYHVYAANNQPWNGNEGEATTDTAINLIFENYAIDYCYDQNNGGENDLVFARYEGPDLEAFISALQNNPNVLNVKACLTNYTYADLMYISLSDGANGNPIGFDENGDVITTDAALNAVFSNYHVKEMAVMSVNLNIYTISFESNNAAGIKYDLDNLTLFSNPSEFVPTYLLLDTGNTAINKPSVCPNPFSTTFEITTQENIIEYSLCDISGKTLVNTSEKSTLDQKAALLNSGLYFLTMQSDNGKSHTQKVIKM